MVKLNELEDDDKLASGFMERRVIEQCRAACTDCKRYSSDWTDYDNALAKFIEHREWHRKEAAEVRPL